VRLDRIHFDILGEHLHRVRHGRAQLVVALEAFSRALRGATGTECIAALVEGRRDAKILRGEETRNIDRVAAVRKRRRDVAHPDRGYREIAAAARIGRVGAVRAKPRILELDGDLLSDPAEGDDLCVADAAAVEKSGRGAKPGAQGRGVEETGGYAV